MVQALVALVAFVVLGPLAEAMLPEARAGGTENLCYKVKYKVKQEHQRRSPCPPRLVTAPAHIDLGGEGRGDGSQSAGPLRACGSLSASRASVGHFVKTGKHRRVHTTLRGMNPKLACARRGARH